VLKKLQGRFKVSLESFFLIFIFSTALWHQKFDIFTQNLEYI
jgi:hypothetical protein